MAQDVAIPGIEALVEYQIGLKSQVIGTMWEDALRIRMETLGTASLEEYYDRLVKNRAECQALIELIVVTETSFFRDRAAIDYLVKSICQKGMNGHPAPWRILSIGCSSGEEPYSIAMALLDKHVKASRFSIMACDISRAVVNRAEKGVYRKSSFRGKDLKYRETYFDLIDEGQHYQIHQELRHLVRFHTANIVDPWFLAGSRSFDSIFFRNVLVYLGEEAQNKALQHCKKLLKSDGLLVVGPTEIKIVTAKGFVPIGPANICAFQLTGQSAERTQIPVKHKSHPEKEKKLSRKAQPVLQTEESDSQQMLKEAQMRADKGEMDAAITTCHRYIALYGACADVYFLLGILEIASKCDVRAEHYFKKTIYLEPDHYEALVNLALIAERSGDLKTSQRLWKRARRAHKDS